MQRVLCGLAFLAALAVAIDVSAEQYPGWGDTGWVYASRRDCCNAAIGFANDYSAEACMTSGGRPSEFRGGVQRGTCQVEWAQDDSGGMLYRCYGEAAVWCR
jgi:hypothetical protein